MTGAVVTVQTNHIQANLPWSGSALTLEVYDNAVSSTPIDLNTRTQVILISDVVYITRGGSGSFTKRILSYIFGTPHPSEYVRGKEKR